MGLFQNSAADLGAMAAAALDSGRRRFTVRLVALPGSKDDAIDPWSQRIETIEEKGWELDEFSVVPNENGWVEAYVLFKRG
ncbi:hypothetical protein AB0I53_48545 [Saccharopolyspora sp. NPDC050389]|uniref:hypothetical protein n=1 Tax=Saccharopolyspora sp. NPDC050389 TaxID=3155516 RepID=UPI0033FB6E7E